MDKEDAVRNAAAGEWMSTHARKFKLCKTSRGQQKERKGVCVTEWVRPRKRERGGGELGWDEMRWVCLCWERWISVSPATCAGVSVKLLGPDKGLATAWVWASIDWLPHWFSWAWAQSGEQSSDLYHCSSMCQGLQRPPRAISMIASPELMLQKHWRDTMDEKTCAI